MTDQVEASLAAADAELEKTRATVNRIRKLHEEKLLSEMDRRPVPLPDFNVWNSYPPNYADELEHFGIDTLFGGHQKLVEAHGAVQRTREQAKMRDLAASKVADLEKEKVRIETNRAVWQKIWRFVCVLPPQMQPLFQITETGWLIGTEKAKCFCGFEFKFDLIPNLNYLLDSPYHGMWIRRKHPHNPVKEAPYRDFVGGVRIQSPIGIYWDVKAQTDASLGRPVKALLGVPPDMAADEPVI